MGPRLAPACPPSICTGGSALRLRMAARRDSEPGRVYPWEALGAAKDISSGRRQPMRQIATEFSVAALCIAGFLLAVALLGMGLLSWAPSKTPAARLADAHRPRR